MTPSPPSSTLYRLAVSHGLHDLYTGTWLLILAAQVTWLGLSYTEAGLAQAAYTLVSAITQPGFGGYFDRTGKPNRALWSVAITPIFITLAALAQSYSLLILFGVGAGLGSAAYHAAGLSSAKQLAAGRGQGRATAIFLLGGNGGFAVGAYLGGVVLDQYGASYLTAPLVVMVFMAPILERALRPYLLRDGEQTERTTRQLIANGRTSWVPALAFIAVVFANQAYVGGFSTYLPQFYEQGGNSLGYAGAFTGLYLLFAAIGSFVGGSLSDRLPRLWVAAGAMVAIAPLSVLLLNTTGIALGLVSILLGLITNLPLPILLLIGQEVMPGGASGASGYAFGITFLARAIMTPIAGALADQIGLKESLLVMGVLPMLFVGLLVMLPKDQEYTRLPHKDREKVAL